MAVTSRSVGDFAQAKFPRVEPTATVRDAIAAMRSLHVTCVLVVSQERLQGIFTERDFLNRVIGQQLLPGGTPVADVMTAAPEVLHTTEPIGEAILHMARGGFRNMPIVDDDGIPTGILSARDVVEHLSELFVPEDEEARQFGGAWLDLEDES